MNSRPSFDDLLSEWLEYGPAYAPATILETVAAALPSIPQRRVLVRVPWRFPPMNTYAKMAVAAVAVIAVGAIGLAVLRPDSGQVGGPTISPSPPPTPSPSLVASPSPSPLPALTERFTSAIHGISVAYPAGWSVNAATRPWTTGLPRTQEGGRDTIENGATDSTFIGLASQPLAGVSGDQWAAERSSASFWGDACDPVPSEPVSIDNASGILVVGCPERPMSALTWVGDRGYWIVLYGESDLASFKEILATVQLNPEDAVDASPSATP